MSYTVPNHCSTIRKPVSEISSATTIHAPRRQHCKDVKKLTQQHVAAPAAVLGFGVLLARIISNLEMQTLEKEQKPANAIALIRDWLLGTAGRRGDLIAALLVAIMTLAFFNRTVFKGLPISKIAYLGEWDSLFSAMWTGQKVSCDPSINLLTIPYYFIVGHLWKAAQLPLWNTYSGFGSPLVADIQAAVFSPLRIGAYLFPSASTYNLTVVFEVVLAAVGAYALARSVNIARYAAIFAGLTYAICPYNLFYLEQISGTSAALFPFLFFLFARLANCATIGRSLAAGAGCAVLILSGHPESSFFGIIYASALMLALFTASNPTQLPKTIVKATGCLALAGMVALCLSAPVFFPFIEFLLNSDSYKFTIGGSTWIPWQGIIYNLLQPGFGSASPFPGIIAAIALPLGIVAAIRNRGGQLAVFAIALFAFAITTRLGPLDWLFNHKPWSILINVYCMPVTLLLFILLSASGLEELIERTKLTVSANLIWLLLAAFCVVAVPLGLYGLNVPLQIGDFDMMIPHMAVDIRAWQLQVGLLAGALTLIFVFEKFLQNQKAILCLALVALSFASQAVIAKNSLPNQRAFDYPVVEPIPELQKEHARMVALGAHLFRPNTAAVYGINDIRSHNPLFPSRYLEYMTASGAEVETFNQTFKSYDSKLLDLAAVRYILSLEPISDAPNLKLLRKTAQNIHVYESTTALPRAFLARNPVSVSSREEALAKVKAPEFDPKQSVVIESKETENPQQNDKEGIGNLQIKEAESGNVSIDCTVTNPSILVLCDTYYPGWTALVDGQPKPILRANYLFRAVELPAGKHTVQFIYRPLSFVYGAVLFGLCILAIGATVAWKHFPHPKSK